MNNLAISKGVVISGGSSGIGAQCALEYAKRGYNIVLIARNKNRLEEIKNKCLSINQNIKVQYFICDLTKETQIVGVAESSIEFLKDIDVLLLSAGSTQRGAFADSNQANTKQVIDTNIYGTINLVRNFTEALKKSKGRILIVGSLFSVVAVKNRSAYCMSKSALNSFARCIRSELKPFGVSVTQVFPSFVTTGIHKDASSPIHQQFRWLFMPADKAARLILRHADLRHETKTLSLHGKILLFLHRVSPKFVETLLNRMVRN